MTSASIPQQLLLQFTLILLNAFFAASEMALISLNEGRLKKQGEAGDKKAKKLLAIIEEPTNFLSAIQIGITLAGFLGSAFAASSFSSRIVAWLMNLGLTGISHATLETISVLLITLILSFFMLLLGELVPKRIAMKRPEQLARSVCGIIFVISVILKPVVRLMTACTNGLLRLFGINPREAAAVNSEEEIIMMLDIGEENGSIESDEKELIENVFAFNDVTAADVMVHRTRTTFVWLDSTPEEVMDVISECGYSRIPVCGENIDDIVGILYTKEYLLELQKNAGQDIASMLHPAKFVPESIPAHDLLREMQRDRIHMVMVVDEFGGIAGIVTLEDILEEIVGEIFDESDEIVESFTKTGDSTYHVLGDMDLDDMLENFGLQAEAESDSVSVSGWVTEHFSRIPDEGESFVFENLRVLVLKTDHKQILEVQIDLLPQEEIVS